MISCRGSKDLMIEALYGELGPAEREEFDAHLRSCPDCAAEYSVLGATLRVMDERRRPDPGPAFWDGYWNRLAAKMGAEAAPATGRLPLAFRLRRAFEVLPRWPYQAAAGAALIVVGILIGRAVFGPGGRTPRLAGVTTARAATAVSDDPALRARRYVDRSQVLLLGLVNYDPKTQDVAGFDLAGKKAASRELAAEAADIRTSLKDPRQKRYRELVSELEVILMQIANLDAGNDLDGVELVKQGVTDKGIFLKIDLSRMGWSGPALPGPGPRTGPGASAAGGHAKDKI
ncbi:MAG TPA: anti-sigma factor [Terriglobales bacterium]|nr:anti-sigma factor [Terriglobales bacterium]